VDDPLLTVRQVAQTFQVADKTIRRWIARGTVKAVKTSAGWRIPRSEVERLLRTT
jgi:excisionase family DNA binding protein